MNLGPVEIVYIGGPVVPPDSEDRLDPVKSIDLTTLRISMTLFG